MKVDLKVLLSTVPPVLHEGIRQSPYCASRSDSLVISSDESRKQNDNRISCETKLQDLIREVGRQSVPGETSTETKRRVGRLSVFARDDYLLPRLLLIQEGRS